MITGFAVLGLLHLPQLNLNAGSSIDFERIMPAVIVNYVPSGWMGLLLAGLLAAFIGTFAATLNAAQAYLVNDVYLKYIRPAASAAQTRKVTYGVGLLVVLISIVFGMYVQNVNSILQWIVSALYGSYVAANVLKWHWWRFNGEGFFWGMIAGMVPALVLPYIFPNTLELYYFPLILAFSIAGCIVGTFSAPPVPMPVLVQFYTSVRPWGWWAPVIEQARKYNAELIPNTDFKRDALNIVIGIVGQLCLTLLPVYFVLSMHLNLMTTILILSICILILRKTWWLPLHQKV
jgi:Na+/proline symporter